MKCIKRLTIFLAVLAVLTSCSDKKNPNGIEKDAADGSMKASIAGSLTLAFDSDGAIAYYDEGDDFFTIIAAMQQGNTEYAFVFMFDREPGQFTVNLGPILQMANDSGLGIFSLDTGNDNDPAFHSISGTFSITDATNRLKGTFHFTGRNGEDAAEITVSQGTFDAPLRATP